MRVILAGGGTGGHVIPALAIARQLQQDYGAETLFVGTPRGIENRLVPAAGFPLRLIEVGALKNVTLATRLKTGLVLPRAIRHASKIVAEFRPQVVIGVGGYASGPAMLAALFARIPRIAFEPNVVPGLANRAVARFVSAAAVHFQQTCRYFPNCQVTGVPVRQAFFDVPGNPPPPRPTLVVFGGSQGAHAINQAIVDSLPLLAAAMPLLHIVHQTGERDFPDAELAYRRSTLSHEIFPFIDDMPAAFSRATLLLCRSGASTVAEVTAAGKPALFIPFPHAADDHQKVNAQALVRAGAASLLDQSQLTPQRLVESLTSLLSDPARLQAMSSAARALSHPDAARQIARMAARLAGIADRGQTSAALRE